MKRGGYCIVAALTLALAAGRTSAATLYDEGASKYVVHLAVSGPAEIEPTAEMDKDQQVKKAVGLGLMLGAVVSVGVISANQQSAEEGQDIDHILESQNVRFGEEMRAGIEAALVAPGYAIEKEPSFDTDGILDVSIDDIAYRGAFGSFSPVIVMHARLVSMNSHDILFDQTLEFSPGRASRSHLAADPQYTFSSRAELLTHSEQAAAGLRSSIPLFAAAIAAGLSRP